MMGNEADQPSSKKFAAYPNGQCFRTQRQGNSKNYPNSSKGDYSEWFVLGNKIRPQQWYNEGAIRNIDFEKIRNEEFRRRPNRNESGKPKYMHFGFVALT